MKSVRNLAFLLLCMFVLVGRQAPIGAFDECEIGDPQWSIDPECPYAVYNESYCPFAVGCLDALAAAEDWCEFLEGEYSTTMVLEGFECEDPLEPPTEFSFRCVPFVYPCIE